MREYLYIDDKGNHRIDHIKLANQILKENKFIRFKSRLYKNETIYYFIQIIGWVKIEERDIRDIIVHELEQYHKRNIVNECLDYMMAHIEVFENEYFNNLTKSQIPVRNGIIDYSDETNIRLLPYTENTYHDFLLNFNFSLDLEEHKNPLVQFAEFTLRDGAQTFFEAVGLMLMSENPLPFIMILHGSGGDGKSTLTRPIVKLLGEKCSTLSLDRLSSTDGSKFVLGNLLGKQANICADDKTTMVNRLEDLKGLSGNDYMDFELKGIQDTVRMQMGVKFLFCMNEIPRMSEINKATIRRFYILKMQQSMEKVREYIDENFGPDYDDNYFDSFLDGFAIHCLKHAIRIKTYSFDSLTMSDSVKNGIDQWFKDNDQVQEFLDDHTIDCDGAYDSLKDFTDRYNNEYGTKISNMKFKQDLIKKGIIIKQSKLKQDDDSYSKQPVNNAIFNKRLYREYLIKSNPSILPFHKK